MNWNKTKQFEQPPVGSFLARCFQIIDLGTQPKVNRIAGTTEYKRQVRIVFEIPSELMLGTYDEKVKGRPFAVSVTCTQSLHPKAVLTKLMEGWAGKKFTDETRRDFNPKNLIGKACRLALIENGDYVNIDSISKLGKNESCQPAVNPPLYFSLDEGEFDPATLEKMSNNLRDKIKASPEYKQLVGEHDASEPTEAAVVPKAEDDDVPF